MKINLIETNIELLKLVNIKTFHKLDFELRRKSGNIIAKHILSSFSDKLDKIESNKNIYYDVEEIEEKIKQCNKIIGPDIIKREYLNKLNKNYINSLKILEANTKLKIENFQKNNFDCYKTIENKPQVKFICSFKSEEEIKECVVLTLFFLFKDSLGQKFNDSLHNRTMKINMQIKDCLQKMKKKSNNFNDNKYNKIQKDDKNKKVSNILEFSSNNTIDLSGKKCPKFYEPLILMKKYYKVKRDLIFEGDVKTPIILLSKINEKIDDSSLNDFKEYLNNMSKSYELKDNISLDKAIDLYFKNEKIDNLVDSPIFIKSRKLDQELESLKSNKEEEEALKYFNEIEINLQNNIKMVQDFKNKIYEHIEKYSECFDIQKLFHLNKKSNGLDPYAAVKTFDINKSIIDNKIEEAFYYFIVSLYFCYEGYLNYLSKIKEKIIELDYKGLNERNRVKNFLIEKLKLNLSTIEEDDEFITVWNIMKKRKIFIKNDEFLNAKIEEYILNKNIDNFMSDLKELMKSKNINFINLEQKDPQILSLNPL